MNKRTHQLFHDSLDRCTQNPRFLETFFARLLGSSEEIAALFHDTDMDRLRRLLEVALYVCMQAATGDPEAEAFCRRLAEQHRGIPAAFYEVWLDALITTVGEVDPRFDPATERAWRDMLRPGIEILKQTASLIAPP